MSIQLHETEQKKEEQFIVKHDNHFVTLSKSILEDFVKIYAFYYQLPHIVQKRDISAAGFTAEGIVQVKSGLTYDFGDIDLEGWIRRKQKRNTKTRAFSITIDINKLKSKVGATFFEQHKIDVSKYLEAIASIQFGAFHNTNIKVKSYRFSITSTAFVMKMYEVKGNIIFIRAEYPKLKQFKGKAIDVLRYAKLLQDAFNGRMVREIEDKLREITEFISGVISSYKREFEKVVQGVDTQIALLGKSNSDFFSMVKRFKDGLPKADFFDKTLAETKDELESLRIMTQNTHKKIKEFQGIFRKLFNEWNRSSIILTTTNVKQTSTPSEPTIQSTGGGTETIILQTDQVDFADPLSDDIRKFWNQLRSKNSNQIIKIVPLTIRGSAFFALDTKTDAKDLIDNLESVFNNYPKLQERVTISINTMDKIIGQASLRNQRDAITKRQTIWTNFKDAIDKIVKMAFG